MLDDKTPTFKMQLGGCDFSDEKLYKCVTQIEVHTGGDAADYFKVTLDDAENQHESDLKIKEGDSAEIKLGFQDSGTELVFKGDVTGVRGFREEHRRQEMVIEGFDPMHKLTRGRNRKSYLDMSYNDIAKKIAGEAGLSCDVGKVNIVHDYVFENNCTHLSFLYELARKIGYHVDYDVEKDQLLFKEPELEGKGEVELIWDDTNMPKGGGGGNQRLLQRCKFRTQTMGQVKKVVARHYDPATRESLVAESEEIHGQSMGGQQTGADRAEPAEIQISDQPFRSVEEGEKLAKSILNQRALEFMTGTGQCVGHAKVRAGKLIEVKHYSGEMDGSYWVRSAQHILRMGAGSGHGYHIKFEICRTGR